MVFAIATEDASDGSGSSLILCSVQHITRQQSHYRL